MKNYIIICFIINQSHCNNIYLIRIQAMIQRVAKTVIKAKDFLEFTSFKIVYPFSNKQDPFKKFRKPINKQNMQNKSQTIKNPEMQNKNSKSQSIPQKKKAQNSTHLYEQQNSFKTSAPGFDKFKRIPKSEQQIQKQKVEQKQSLKTQSKLSQQINNDKKQKLQQKRKSNINMPLGFSKFKVKADNIQQNKLKAKPQSESKQNQAQLNKLKQKQGLSEMQKKMINQIRKINQDPKIQKIKRPDQKEIIQKLKEEEKKKITDAFAKFKKTDKSEQSNNNQKQKKEIQSQDQKSQPILNQKQHSKQQIYENTEKKKEEQKEQWEKFFQEQVKKNKNKQGQPSWSNWINSTMQNMNKQAQNKKKQNGQTPPPVLTPKSLMIRLFIGGLAVVLLFNMASDFTRRDRSTLISPQQLMNMVRTNSVKQTWFLKIIESMGDESQSRTKQYTCIQLMNGQKFKCESNDQFQIEWNKFIDKNNEEAFFFQNKEVITKKPYILKRDSHIFNLIRSVLGYGLLFMFIQSIMNASKGAGKNMGKGGGNMSELFGTGAKSNRYSQVVNVKFNDVVGMNKAKQQIVQFIDFLMKPEKYNKLGARIPRGALLTGPPGTGKTMLAKACAGQGNVPFFTISGSQFMEMYVGVGAQRVRNLFKQAKQCAPSIIFIDQIDAVGKKRASGPGGSSNSQRDNTLNQLLVQMDGFQTGTNVIVFAATNQKQVLDPALTRPGRFDRLIEVDLPDIQGRRQIFLVHLKPIILNQNNSVEEYAKRLATLTPGFSGADIKNLCNQAAIIAARGDKKSVSMIDFQLASERVIGGVQKKSSLITPQTRRTVAYHECGHGVVSWFMQHANPLLKLTIIPRSKGALGYAQYLPNQNQMYTKQQLMDQICVILGGRIAEQIFFGKISTGASDDLQKAFKVAKAIVAQYGMGKTLNWTSYSQTEYVKEYSTMIEEKIDDQILSIVGQCAIRTRLIIEDKKQLIGKLAQQLLKVETIDQKIISSILGERPFKNSKQYQQYIRQKNKISDQNNSNPPPPAVDPQINFGQLLTKMIKPSSKKIQYIESN